MTTTFLLFDLCERVEQPVRNSLRCWVNRNYQKVRVGEYIGNANEALDRFLCRKGFPVVSEEPRLQIELRAYAKKLEEENRVLRDWRDLHRSVAREVSAMVGKEELPTPTSYVREGNYCEFFLELSDWHIGDGFAYSLSHYDEDMLRGMVAAMLEKVEKCIADAQLPVRALNVLFLGDMVHGDGIYPKQHLSLLYASHRQIAVFVSVASELLRRLAAVVPKLRVFAVRGNHGRTGDKWSSVHPNSNWDMAAYLWCEAQTREFAEWRIEEKDDHYIASLDGLKLVMSHGDHIKINNRVPYYGLEDYLKSTSEWFATQQYAARLIFCGHFHTSIPIASEKATLYCNGSLQGFTQFAKNGRYAPQARIQNLICWGWGVEDHPIEINFQKLYLGRGVDASSVEEIEVE